MSKHGDMLHTLELQRNAVFIEYKLRVTNRQRNGPAMQAHPKVIGVSLWSPFIPCFIDLHAFPYITYTVCPLVYVNKWTCSQHKNMVINLIHCNAQCCTSHDMWRFWSRYTFWKKRLSHPNFLYLARCISVMGYVLRILSKWSLWWLNEWWFSWILTVLIISC